jgi:16S rRNA (guanine527-N7)-methyltransferase
VTPLKRALSLAGLDVEVDDDAQTRLEEFVELRAHWAQTHNLAGPQALASPWQSDVVDGLAVAVIMEPRLPLVDVGSGGGIPGLVVAAFAPDRVVLLVEPRAKRAAFLRTAAHALRLSQVTVVRDRWPLSRLQGPVQVVSRAVVSPLVWPSMALEGGTDVEGVIRMLAAERPTIQELEIERVRAVDYGSIHEGGRRVEYWSRIPVAHQSGSGGNEVSFDSSS